MALVNTADKKMAFIKWDAKLGKYKLTFHHKINPKKWGLCNNKK